MVAALSPPGTGPGGPGQHLVGCILALGLAGAWWEARGPGLAPDWVGCLSMGEWETGLGTILLWRPSASVAPCW